MGSTYLNGEVVFPAWRTAGPGFDSRAGGAASMRTDEGISVLW